MIFYAFDYRFDHLLALGYYGQPFADLVLLRLFHTNNLR